MPDAANISLGGGLSIGRARGDVANIRGEGGASSPRLVVPVIIEMFPRPATHQVALLRLTASLHTNQNVQPESRLGPLVGVDLVEGMPCTSTPHPPHPHTVEFRFDLTPAMTNRFEELRHSNSTHGRFAFYLNLAPIAAWLRETGNVAPSNVGQVWPSDAGLFSLASLFWTSRIDPLRVEVETSLWIERVLPRWGLDHIRLVEINLPRTDPGTTGESGAAALFDKARHEFDAQRYSNCVVACRGVQNFLEIALGATRDHTVAEVMQERRGWGSKDARVACLDKVWQGLDILVNAASHPERGQPIDSADARFCLHLTAILAEYIQSLGSNVSGTLSLPPP